MNAVNIMSVVGSAVPKHLRQSGLLACWYVVRDGQPIAGPLTTLLQAENACRSLGNTSIH
jgi:hypothetical protein